MIRGLQESGEFFCILFLIIINLEHVNAYLVLLYYFYLDIFTPIGDASCPFGGQALAVGQRQNLFLLCLS